MDVYQRNRFCPCVRCRMNSMMGPAIMIVIGTLWLLHSYYIGRAGTYLAVLLIVIGGVKLLQSSASAEGHRQPYPYYAGQVPPAGTAPDPSSHTDNTQVNNNG
jgi:hypothetical protein